MGDKYGIGVDLGKGDDWWAICRKSAYDLEESLKWLCRSMDEFYIVMNKIYALKTDYRVKRRKTTYKTIRRDCAKRNRHK